MRIYKVDTAKLAKWLVPAQLRTGVIYAFIKALLKSVQKSYDTLFKQPIPGNIDSGIYYALYSWPQMLLSVWEYVERFWRINSSLLVVRVAVSNYIPAKYGNFLYGFRYVINHEQLSSFTPAVNDAVCWWDESENYEHIQFQGPGGWVDDRFLIKDGISLSLPFSARIDEVATGTQLMNLQLLSEGEAASSLLISETEPPADIDFQFNKAEWTAPVWDTNPIIPNYYYIGDARLNQMYVDAITVLAPFKSFGRTIRMTTI